MDPHVPKPEAAVVIVVWKPHPELDECLEGLVRQTNPNIEVFVADNGADVADRVERFQDRLRIRHVPMGGNRGPSAARNAAAALAIAEVVMFLDDDAIPADDWVAALLGALDAPGIVAARGRVAPKAARLLNELARAYDLGGATRPAIINTEGNCAIDRRVLLDLGGFNDEMFGHEGAELSGRIIDRHGVSSIVYTPEPVIFHDYAKSLSDYLRKRFRHGRMLRHLDLAHTRHAASTSRRRSTWTWRRLALIPVKVLGIVAEAAGLAWSVVDRRRDGRTGLTPGSSSPG
jgi:GT2 family glycosyltransferase